MTESLDRLPVELVRRTAVTKERTSARLDPECPLGAARLSHRGQLLEGSRRTLGIPTSYLRLDEFGERPLRRTEFERKQPNRRRIGKYRAQYVYRCPNTRCRHQVVEPYILPAAAAIDWSDPGKRIGDRPRTRAKPEGLAPATIRRIRAGLAQFTEPTMVTLNHGGHDPRAYPAGAGPLPARTTKIGDGVATPPVIVPAGRTWNHAATSAPDPLPTRPANANGHDALLVPPFVTMMRAHNRATGVDEPLATVATGRHHYLTVPPGAFYTKHFTPRTNPGQMAKDVRTQPLGSITASDHHGLVIPYRKGTIRTTAEPLHTLATRPSLGLLRAQIDIADCLCRMLKPREHLRAQRIPDHYIVTGNLGEQTMQAGNAVSANVAQWLGEQVAAVLCATAAA